MVSRLFYQSDGDQLWSRECYPSQLEIIYGLQNVLPVKWRSVVVSRVSYQSGGGQ